MTTYSNGKIMPSINDILALERPLEAIPCPDGSKIAYLIGKANLKENFHEHNCYVYDIEKNESLKLTQDGVVSNLRWIDSNSLALLKSNPSGDDEQKKPQIFIYDNLMGDGLKITNHKSGIQKFIVHDFGFIFLANNPDLEEKKDRKEKFGSFVQVESEDSVSNLYYISLQKKKSYLETIKLLTEKEIEKETDPVLDLSTYFSFQRKITNFFSNDKHIWINFQARDDLVFLSDTSCFRLKIDLETVLNEKIKYHKEKSNGKQNDNNEKKVFGEFELDEAKIPKGASIVSLSPEGEKILVLYRIKSNKMYIQPDIGIFDVTSFENDPEKEIELLRISQKFNHTGLNFKWNRDGIFVTHIQESSAKIVKISETGEIEDINIGNYHPLYVFNLSQEGTIAFPAGSQKGYNEIVVVQKINKMWEAKAITNLDKSVENWNLGSVESIKWQSEDGTEIEGVLRKPENFDSTKKYPLVFVVHGGPSWYSPNILLEGLDNLYYPSVQFVNKDILVLKPNYRGSLGRGQEFLELNKDNLGIGDLWDLNGAIDYLVSEGFVDENKIGCMGWSQGGYISAFVSTHSKRFKAVSIGAGVSSWYTYHITNDIRQFTTDYLSGSPFTNPEIYEKTAPISKIKDANTPALIQHGQNDQRVPLANALELHRGFKEMGVPTELFVFEGMPHSITKPRENRAVLNQNLAWFAYYLLGEELNFDDYA